MILIRFTPIGVGMICMVYFEKSNKIHQYTSGGTAKVYACDVGQVQTPKEYPARRHQSRSPEACSIPMAFSP